jgi:transposase
MTVVLDHDTGRLVWAAPGRDKATLALFFDALGEERCKLITHVSADGADWISAVVAETCPNAVRCADPFHIVRWATDALDQVRRQAWNEARGAVTQRRAGRACGQVKALKHAR